MVAVRVCFVTIILTILYLLGSVLIATLIFNYNSTGSLVYLDKKIIGSKLIGQDFKDKFFFHNRPSQANYKNDISGNSNYPYYSKKLLKTISDNYNSYKNENFGNEPDLNILTESASGLDPDITYEAAISQSKRIAKLSRLSEEQIVSLIKKKASPLVLGLFGQKIVNVLELNIELKQIYAKTRRS